LFKGIDLAGKRVLEIGSGGGLRSVFMALQGAASVVSLEPGLAGSRGHYRTLQRQRLEKLGLRNVEFLEADFNLWDAGSSRFDIIVSESSINHLHESRFHALRHHDTYQNYLRVCRKMCSLLVPSGVACISDACRYGLFSALRRFGIRRPWTGKRVSAIWQIHQNPGVWRRILMDAGFLGVDVRYPLPHRLRYLGALAANPLSNFFLRSYFYLRARR
jgi:cyclopropane fatty-acyl-phospholipid synthase-like methyltransferase